MEVDASTLSAMVVEYEQNGYEVSHYDGEFGYIEFAEYKTNCRSLGDIALNHGCFISAWDPNRDPPRVYYERFEVTTETEVVERTVVRPGEQPLTDDGPGTPIECVIEETRRDADGEGFETPPMDEVLEPNSEAEGL